MNFKKKMLSILTLSSLMLFAACGEKGEEGKKDVKSEAVKKAPAKEQLVVAQEGEPKTLDVHSGNDGFSLRVNKHLYSRLVESDGDMKIHPGLAESWENLDEKTTQFKLRKGVKFHNGDELKAEDVKYSFERMMDSPRISFVLPPIDRIDIVDDYTINMVTKTPFGPLLAHLSHPALGIVSKKQLTEDPEGFKNHPIGTGPYKYSEWKAGDRVILERNDDYFMAPANFKNLVFRNIVEANSRTIGLETGELDIALSISSVDENTIKNDPNLQLITKPSISFTYVGLNNEKGPFKDERVRKAVNYAIDKQAIIDVVLAGAGNIATSPIAPAVFGFTDKTKAYDFDLEKAKELMKEAGYEKGFTSTIYILGGEADRQTAEIIQSDLKKIGIDLKINILENSAYWDVTAKGDHDMFLGSWGTVTGDADYGLYAMYHTNAKGAPGNRDFYSNEAVDKMLDEAKTTIDQDRRKKLYEDIQIQIVDDAPDVMLYNRTLAVGAQKNIGGLNIHPVTLHDFYPVYIKE